MRAAIQFSIAQSLSLRTRLLLCMCLHTRLFLRKQCGLLCTCLFLCEACCFLYTRLLLRASWFLRKSCLLCGSSAQELCVLRL